MTNRDQAELLASYCAGLNAALTCLDEIERVALRQREALVTRDLRSFVAACDARDRLAASLFSLEPGLQTAQVRIRQFETEGAHGPELERVREGRRRTMAAVTRILALDHDAIGMLANADLARRAALDSVERGEHTLAAYRRVLAPAADSSLVDAVG